MTGLRTLIEKLLGPWSIQVLDFYEANSLPINIIVVTYGLVLVLSWFNLDAIRRQLVSAVVAQMHDHPEMGTDAKLKQVLRKVNIPWEGAVSQARFPLVAGRWAFRLRRTSIEAVQALLLPEELVKDALKALEAESDDPSQQISSKE